MVVVTTRLSRLRLIEFIITNKEDDLEKVLMNKTHMQFVGNSQRED